MTAELITATAGGARRDVGTTFSEGKYRGYVCDVCGEELPHETSRDVHFRRAQRGLGCQPSAQISGGTPSAESDCSVIEMGLCEVEHVMLRPNQLYRFIVMPDCDKCKALDVYSPNAQGDSLPLRKDNHGQGAK